MKTADRRALALAAQNHQIVKVVYNKPGVGPVTRHVRPHEVSVNRSGRAVVWGTDSIHGPQQIHAFRLDRVVEVVLSKRPTTFAPEHEVTRYLQSYGFGNKSNTTVTVGNPTHVAPVARAPVTPPLKLQRRSPK
jgi:predicted DNA-binding transcriptional regulator YafY